MLKKIFAITVVLLFFLVCGCQKKDNEWELRTIEYNNEVLGASNGYGVQGTLKFLEGDSVKVTAYLNGDELLNYTFDYYVTEGNGTDIYVLVVDGGYFTASLQTMGSLDVFNLKIGDAWYNYSKQAD